MTDSRYSRYISAAGYRSWDTSHCGISVEVGDSLALDKSQAITNLHADSTVHLQTPCGMTS